LRSSIAPAAVTAVLNLIPHLGPFFAPSERALANWANLGGQVGFFHVELHKHSWGISVVAFNKTIHQ
jgi:hypothetical protein